MYCTGNNIYDKQVQGGSVLIIEPGTLCVFQKPKSGVCEVLKEGKIKRWGKNTAGVKTKVDFGISKFEGFFTPPMFVVLL